MSLKLRYILTANYIYIQAKQKESGAPALYTYICTNTTFSLYRGAVLYMVV